MSLVMAFVVGAMGVFLMMGGLGEGQERCPANAECIEYPEHGSGTVVGYSAVDPEGEAVTWAVSGTDASLFDIEEGRLTFESPPDFEDPDDNGTNNEYEVTIEARDATAADTNIRIGDRPVSKSLVVRVKNVEESGEITLSTLQPQEGVDILATLRDPDGKPRGNDNSLPVSSNDKNLTGEGTTKWQWARSARASGPWTDIVDDENTKEVEEGKGADYEPRAEDVAMYLRVTATYDDGHCTPCVTKKTAQAISANAARAKPYTNVPPEFKDENGKGITATVREVSGEFPLRGRR